MVFKTTCQNPVKECQNCQKVTETVEKYPKPYTFFSQSLELLNEAKHD